TFDLTVPTTAEVDSAMVATGAIIASYVNEPSSRTPANAWLYLKGNRPYLLEERPAAMQRNVRRALREFRIAPLSASDVIQHGARAFCDTRQRNGLDDGTLSGFHRYFEHHVSRPGRTYLGAWRNGELAAFLTIVLVDDWAELGSFSATSLLRYRPNDGLFFAALSNYLAYPACRVICYGLSSVEADRETTGLHRFKVKIGFDAQRVHRAFVLHPRIRPFATRAAVAAAHATVRASLRLRPDSRRLKKIGGMLASMLQLLSPAVVSASEAAPVTTVAAMFDG